MHGRVTGIVTHGRLCRADRVVLAVGPVAGSAAWLPAAHELSRKMSAPEHRALMPATVFAHAPDQSDVADPPSTFGAANTNGSHA